MSTYASDVAGTGRERDSAALPELMRRDVRLLGEVLGEVISESAGADLLADVERLRHAVIAARSAADRGSAQAAAAGDEIMALVSAWSWERAELVARAFTVYFHLVNLAEEEQRVRALRQRDSGNRPARESLADAVDRLTAEGGTEHLNRLLAGLLGAGNRVLTRAQLTELLRGRDADPFDRSIDVRVSRLRQILGDDARAPQIIKTVYGEGYVVCVTVATD